MCVDFRARSRFLPMGVFFFNNNRLLNIHIYQCGQTMRNKTSAPPLTRVCVWPPAGAHDIRYTVSKYFPLGWTDIEAKIVCRNMIRLYGRVDVKFNWQKAGTHPLLSLARANQQMKINGKEQSYIVARFTTHAQHIIIEFYLVYNSWVVCSAII